jgi:Domain of unknown function (DUF1735)
MQNKKINNLYTRFLPVVFLAFGMTSCLKSGVDNLNPEGVSSVVELGDIQYPESFSADPLAYDLGYLPFNHDTVNISNDTSSIDIMVDYAGPQFNVPTDITINLALDSAAVTINNNAEESTPYLQVPTSSITLPASVTIPKGQHLAYAHVVINNSALMDSTDYAIGIQITSASSGIVSGNHATAVYQFSSPAP